MQISIMMSPKNEGTVFENYQKCLIFSIFCSPKYFNFRKCLKYKSYENSFSWKKNMWKIHNGWKLLKKSRKLKNLWIWSKILG